jgi:hypothetical protein
MLANFTRSLQTCQSTFDADRRSTELMMPDSLVIPSDDWKLQIDRNKDFVRVSIVDGKGVYRYICLSHEEGAKVCDFLSTEV